MGKVFGGEAVADLGGQVGICQMEEQGHGRQRKPHAHQYGGRKGCWHVPRTANRPFEWWAHLGIW